MQFWFLYTLFVIMLTYAIARKLRVSPTLFFIFSTLFYYLPGHISLGSWGVLYLVKSNAIYLALGALVGSGTISGLRHINTPNLLVIMLGGFLAVRLAVKFNVVNERLGNPVNPIVALFGIGASVALAILLEQFEVIRFVEQWGRLSLEIYVTHSIASATLRIVLQKFFGFVEPSAHILLGTAIGIYAPIALKTICRRIGFRYMFTLRSGVV